MWESFASRTDTFFSSQKLTRNTILVSKRVARDYYSGFYNFKFNNDNTLYLIYNGPEISSFYWPLSEIIPNKQSKIIYNSSTMTILDDKCFFLSSELSFFSSDYGTGHSRQLTLDHASLLRLYSLEKSTGEWLIIWTLTIRVCQVHGLWGKYDIYMYSSEPVCTCQKGLQ